MCVLSMVIDHYSDEWGRRTQRPLFPPPNTWTYPVPKSPVERPITQEEVDEFRRLLERARKYDTEHNEPDCELQEKKQKLLDLAEELGVDIDFL